MALQAALTCLRAGAFVLLIPRRRIPGYHLESWLVVVLISGLRHLRFFIAPAQFQVLRLVPPGRARGLLLFDHLGILLEKLANELGDFRYVTGLRHGLYSKNNFVITAVILNHHQHIE